MSAGQGAGRPIAIFDLDRTITTIGTFTPFMLYGAWRLKPWRLLLLPAGAVLLALTAAKAISRKTLKTNMMRLFLGQVPEERLRPVIRDFIALFRRKYLRPGALEVMAAERARGARILLATASYDFYAADFAHALGMDGCIATPSLRRDGKLLPGLPGENCYGAEKLRRVEAALNLAPGTARPEIVFYSDDKSDLPCLLWADRGVVVNPKPAFARIAAGRGLEVVAW